ncbi:T9SS type A sorting domain-containing protein [Membranihabitans marinus]|uniref:T9SS type A sorting domain-containing protein n=1 Tax=Membranihabitans marinus TaxID=1227546 RepID=UPI001F16DCE0|nr:T9SS type A sorting domain-containing protein [Membranihabitans marinus]
MQSKFTIIPGMLFMLVMMLSSSVEVKAQGPICTSLYPGINADGEIQISISDLIVNQAQLPIKITIRDLRLSQLYQAEHQSLDDVITLNICDHIERDLVFTIENAAGACSDSLHIGIPQLPTMQGRKTTVLCDDSLLLNQRPIGNEFPPIYSGCLKTIDTLVAADWVEKYDCDDYSNDTLKVVYRLLEGYDKFGRRFETKDTIVVLKFPKIYPEDFICAETDTLYCGVNDDFGPKIIFQHPVTMEEIIHPLVEVKVNDDQSLEFLPTSIEEYCQVTNKVSYELIDDTRCENLYKVEVEFSQECFYEEPQMMMRNKGFEDLGKNKYRCTFWVLDIDTLPPVIDIDTMAIVNTVGSHDCEARLVLPDITITDKWSGLRQLKLSVKDHFTSKLVLRNGYYVPEKSLYLPMGGGPYTFNTIEDLDKIVDDIPDFDKFSESENVYKVYIEASDSCNLFSLDSFYVVVRDITGPTVVSNDDLIVGLTSKVTWIDATSFDEDSYDNCAVLKVLGRRKNWATSCGVNLCDGLETDPKINPVEAEYAHYLEWLKIDGETCSDTLYKEWLLDSAYYCAPIDEHGNVLYDGLPPYIGGGWMEKVPFCCEDACQFVDVELLVIDYWCNFGKGWLSVKVEDKQPVSVVQELDNELDLSCNTYNAHYRDIMEKAQSLNNADPNDPERIAAFEALDAALGGYEKVCIDLDGYMTNEDGEIIVPSESNVTVKNQICETYNKRERVYIKNEHTGEYSWEYVSKPAIEYTDIEFDINTGIVAVNCLVTCQQDVWIDLNDCGEGKITRRFLIEKGCKDPETGEWEGVPVKIQKEQVIYVSKGCALNLAMFEWPTEELTVDVCEFEKDELGNYTGLLDPDVLGMPQHLKTEDCSSISIGHKDVLYTLIGDQNENKLKLIRTWIVNEWCIGSQEAENSGKITYDQKIFINKQIDCSASDYKYTISGKVLTPQSKPLPNVSLTASVGSQIKRQTVTNDDGEFVLGFDSKDEVTIIPQKVDNLRSGVTTLDLILIKQDVLGKVIIQDPYQRIAADANQNGVIDPFDVLQLRQLILSPTYLLPNSDSYRFVDVISGKGYGSVELKSSAEMVDFIGIKVGDVNFSGSVSRSSRSQLASNSVVIEDQYMLAGQEYEIPVKMEDFQQIIGLQLELEFLSKAIKNIEILPGRLNIEADQYAIIDGQYLTLSWVDINGQSINKDEVLFSLKFTPEQSVLLRDVLSASNSIMRSETYIDPGLAGELGVKIQSNINYDAVFKGNIPNPFTEQTNIVFELLEEENLTLQVFDVSGREIIRKNHMGNIGRNEIPISGQKLPTAGIYYYRVHGHSWSEVGKMVYIK